MAFNPFESFRKNSKKYLAGLGIMCMFLFVLSSGLQGDAFDQILGWFGASRNKGEHVATLYGDEVWSRKLAEVSNKRLLADRFMKMAYNHTFQNALSEIDKRLDEKEKPRWNQILQQTMQYGHIPGFGTAQLDLFISQTKDETVKKYAQILKRIIPGRVYASLPIPQVDYFPPPFFGRGFHESDDPRQRLKEGDKPLTDRDELLDFLVLQNQAEKLGIAVSEDQARITVNQLLGGSEVLSGDSNKDAAFVQSLFQDQNQFADLDMDLLYEALREEFQVCLAKESVFGNMDRQGYRSTMAALFGTNAISTPVEYFKYYRDNRTTLSIAMLPVTVESFIDTSSQPASEDVLKKLYEKYRDEEPDPTRSRPAFKAPHRMKVEWVSSFPIGQFDANAIAEALPLAGAMTIWEDPGEDTYFKMAQQLQLGFVASQNPILWAALAKYTEEQGFNVLKGSTFSPSATNYRAPSLFTDPSLSVMTAGLNLPRTVASVVGTSALSGLHAGPFSYLHSGLNIAVASQAIPVARGQKFLEGSIKTEVARRAPHLAAVISHSLTPGLSKIGPWFAAANDQQSRYLAWDAIRIQMMDQVRITLAQDLLKNNIAHLKKELADVDAVDTETKQKKANELLSKLIKKYHLEAYHGQSSELITKYEVDDSEGLEDIVAAFQVSQAAGRMTPDANNFAARLFDGDFTKTALYKPQEFTLQGGMGEYVYWKTAEENSRIPKYKDVKDQVLTAWRMQDARKKAREAAEQLAKSISGKSKSDVIDTLNDERLKHPQWLNVLEIDQIAKKIPPKDGETSMSNYSVPPGTFEHPVGNLVDRLLRLKKGQSTVISNQPENRYYVVYLSERYEPKPVEMVDEKSWTVTSDLRNDLTREEATERTARIMEQLRQEASELDAQGRYKLFVEREEDRIGRLDN